MNGCDPPYLTEFTIVAISQELITNDVINEVLDDLLRAIAVRAPGPVLKVSCNARQTEVLH